MFKIPQYNVDIREREREKANAKEFFGQQFHQFPSSHLHA
jgi:hypothetical protein